MTEQTNPCKFFKECDIAQNNFTCLNGGGKYCGRFRELEGRA